MYSTPPTAGFSQALKCALGRRRRCRFSGRGRCRQLSRRLRRRRSAPGLPVEDNQPNRNRTPYAHNDPAKLVLDAPFDVVRDDQQQDAASGVVEEPRVPERHRHRHHQAGHEDGRLQGALFQEEGGQVPAGHERCQDRGGNKRRVAESCSPGRATPFQPGCSPSGPSAGLTMRTANTMRKVEREVKLSEGMPAPAATLSPTTARCTASGTPMAAAYQYHLTRQRIIRKPSSFSPEKPWQIGITMRAAKSGPDGKNLTDSIGKKAHEIA